MSNPLPPLDEKPASPLAPSARPSTLQLRLAKAFRTIFGSIGRVIYRLKTYGVEHIPATGGVLLLPNHITWVDAVILQLACPRPIRFLVFDTIYRQPLLTPIFRLVGAIPISPARARDGMREAVEQLRAGEVVCIFPEGELSRTGTLLRLKKGFEVIARKAASPSCRSGWTNSGDRSSPLKAANIFASSPAACLIR